MNHCVIPNIRCVIAGLYRSAGEQSALGRDGEIRLRGSRGWWFSLHFPMRRRWRRYRINVRDVSGVMAKLAFYCWRKRTRKRERTEGKKKNWEEIRTRLCRWPCENRKIFLYFINTSAGELETTKRTKTSMIHTSRIQSSSSTRDRPFHMHGIVIIINATTISNKKNQMVSLSVSFSLSLPRDSHSLNSLVEYSLCDWMNTNLLFKIEAKYRIICSIRHVLRVHSHSTRQQLSGIVSSDSKPMADLP